MSTALPRGAPAVELGDAGARTGSRARLRGPRGNERLTAWAAAVLFVLLAIEGITILRVSSLIVPHITVGLLLIGPVALKLASTGYRFVRYYTGSAPYQQAGPPRLPLRVLAPFLVVATLAVLATGIALLVEGPGHYGPWLLLHKASFIVWFAVATVHVLAYVGRVPRLIAKDLSRGRPRSSVRRSWARVGVTALAVLAGLALVAATSTLVRPWLVVRGFG